jgi:hypothetical protein
MGSEVSLRWRRLALPNADAPTTAVAVDRDGLRLAVGDREGVLVRALGPEGELDQGARWSRRITAGAVTDLAFASDGALWIATLRGLWRLDESLRLEDRSPAPGDAPRLVHRVLEARGVWVAATEAGAYVSHDGVAWRHIVDGAPSAPMRGIAMRPLSGAADTRVEIWLLGPMDPWRLVASRGQGGLQLEPARRVTVPGRPASQVPLDIVVDAPGAELAILYATAIARVLPAPSPEPRWETIYPVLPPGALALRLSAAAGLLWLGTDQGLMRAVGVAGTLRRAGAPAGRTASGRVVATASVAFAVSTLGLLEGRAELSAALSAEPSGAMQVRTRPTPLPVDPALRLVHERAIEYVGLQPGYMRGLRRRLGGRGWMPSVSLRGAAAFDRDTYDGRDESFTYGELHDLRDHGGSRSRDYDAGVTLSWDLGDVVYPSEAPDLSREARQVVTLRDNLLDEINQLYFDRRRALIALSAFADRSDPEAALLELRCQELAAGLDAWTGGWFSSQIRPAHPQAVERSHLPRPVPPGTP